MMNDYFGKEEFEKFGKFVYSVLEGRAISKSRDLADRVGGLRHEAEMLGMDMFDLLRTIEGLCYNNMAFEVNDSTYVVCKPSRFHLYGIPNPF